MRIPFVSIFGNVFMCMVVVMITYIFSTLSDDVFLTPILAFCGICWIVSSVYDDIKDLLNEDRKPK